MAQVVLYPPVENMTLPWEGEIYGGVKEGTVFFITGTPGENPTQHGFFVNLQEGPMTPDVNIGFHFNPRAPESICIRNSRLGPDWLAEERDAPRFPFKANEQFNIVIRCEKNKFRVDVNGKHLINYQHRINPMCNLSVIRISGEVTIQKVQQQGPPVRSA